MMGSVGSIVLMTSASHAEGVRSYLAGGLFLFATVGFVVMQLDRQHQQRTRLITGSRTAYLHYLHGVRGAVREAAAQQRRALTWRHPAPAALPALAAEGSRLWERDPTHESFLQVRYGVCSQPLALELALPQDAPLDEADPVTASAMHRLLAVHRLQHRLPAGIDLRAFTRIEVCGLPEDARSLTRSLICSAAAFHSPAQLTIAVLTTAPDLAHWDWLKWLPHAQSGRRADAAGPMRLVTTSPADLMTLLPPDLGERPRFGDAELPAVPHLLVVVDAGHWRPTDLSPLAEGPTGVTLVLLPAQWDRLDDPHRLRLELLDLPADDGTRPVRALRLREEPVRALADQCSLATAEAFARKLAPLQSRPADAAGGAAVPSDLMDLLALGEVGVFDPVIAWRPRPARDRLRVPIGLDDGGAPVHLDLKESAQQGMGPHGLVIGATGSGKSELLRTLVLGLALSHSPEQVNLVLVDFKGGATFAGLSRLPHVAAVITNLAEDLTLVDRMQDALSGELVRRQELLRDAGGFASIGDYEKARTAGQDLAPLPSLLIVVDEFSEMLSAKPEFIDLFVAIGRLGRSLGLHLLLASQRLEEGRLRGLESHLSYRVGLRTFSAGESRVVLGVPDAYELPSLPGLGYLKPDQSTLLRFRTAHVSGPASVGSHRRLDPTDAVPCILPFNLSEVRSPNGPGTETPVSGEAHDQESLLDFAVAAMAPHGPEAHRVWLPPLAEPDTLGALMPDLAVDPRLGLTSHLWRGRGGLTIPLGTLDQPRDQRRDVMTIVLSGPAGHVAVVGGPRSGKSTLLRTIVTSLALTTTPLESQVFMLDFGGGALASLAGLPHVAGVGTRAEPDVVRRIIAELEGVVDRREAYFRAQGIDSIETYRGGRATGRADDGYGDLFLVVDGWAMLRADFDDLELELQTLSARGLTFGLHLVVAATRWADFRAAMRDIFGTRLELRLGDPMDSEIDRLAAALVPAGRPGRGLVQSRLHFLAALPRLDSPASAAGPVEGVDDLVTRVAASWPGPAGPKLRLLPELVDLRDVRREAAEAGPAQPILLLGVNERDLGAVGLDVDSEPHLLVLGDSRSGKSGVLRTYLREVTRTRTARQAQIVVVDYRRSLLGEVPDDYLLHYLTSAGPASVALQELAACLEHRLPGPDVTPEQLRKRSWWTGAEVFVVVDDYDLVATQQLSPLHALQTLLAHGRDTGLHVVVARRSGGAARALFEPVLQTLRDLAQPGLLLSGSPEEGPLIGGLRPAPAPAGRGRLVTRERGVEVIQTAWSEPAG